MRQSLVIALTLFVASSGLGAQVPRRAPDTAPHDSAFRAMQERGKLAMGVDQYTSIHHFDTLPEGGRIELQRDRDDSAGVARIRAHMREIARAFKAGDFSRPALVHLREVRGASVMAAKRAVIEYEVHDLPRGAELRVTTSDAGARQAIHEFMAFQRGEHHATGLK